MKHTKEDIRKYNIRRKAAEQYALFTQMILGGAVMSAYGYLGEIFQDLDQMEPDQRQYYVAAITEHAPSAENLAALNLEYERDYQRTLRLVQYAPNLNEEELLLVLTLRDTIYSVYNLFIKAFSIQLMPINELDESIIEKSRYFNLKGVNGRLYHKTYLF